MSPKYEVERHCSTSLGYKKPFSGLEWILNHLEDVHSTEDIAPSYKQLAVSEL